jgi:hypothetical protein
MSQARASLQLGHPLNICGSMKPLIQGATNEIAEPDEDN